MTGPLEAARRALAGEPSSLVVLTIEGTPIAFLVTVGRKAGDLVVPLRAGRNLVGRDQRWPTPPAVEQSQWVIECAPGRAELRDASSTNLSQLVRAGVTTAVPHPLEAAPQRRFLLEEGDLLRTIYASFLFSWV
jgi:hypothetical protein